MAEDITCEETKAQVQEYLQAELSESELDRIMEHLANCESCDEDYALENMLNSVIKDSCQEAPPAELAERIMSKIRSMNYTHEDPATA